MVSSEKSSSDLSVQNINEIRYTVKNVQKNYKKSLLFREIFRILVKNKKNISRYSCNKYVLAEVFHEDRIGVKHIKIGAEKCREKKILVLGSF